jgi:hypothetical protein
MDVNCAFWCTDDQPDCCAGELKLNFNIKRSFGLEGVGINGTALKLFAANFEGAGVFDLRVSAAWMPQSSLHGWIYGVPQIEFTGAQSA